MSISSAFAGQVGRGGSVDDRLARLEDEVVRLPAQWRAEMVDLRDRRVEFRWFGVPLLLVGTVMLAIASW